MDRLSPTGHTCACGAIIVTAHSWKKLDTGQRAEAKAAGFNKAATRDECHRCACRNYVRGTPQDRRRTYAPGEEPYTRAEVVAEWRHLHDPTLSVTQNCEQLGPRMGLTPGALEKHLWRAGIRDDHRQDAAA